MAVAALTILSLLMFFRNWNGRDLLSAKKATTVWQLMKTRQNHSLLYNKEFFFFFFFLSWVPGTEQLKPLDFPSDGNTVVIHELLESLCLAVIMLVTKGGLLDNPCTGHPGRPDHGITG